MQQLYSLRVLPTVEAVPITAESAQWAAEWCKGRLMKEVCPETSVLTVVGVGVYTQYGHKVASMGDYLVKKMSGDFVTLTAEDFDRKYIRATP